MPRAERPQRRVVLMMVLAVLSVTVPFLFWRQTWFGRRLTDREVGEYLQDNQRPRRIQHALSELARRVASGDPAAAAWYPQVLALARHPMPEIRTVAAWLMGQDNRSQAFHQALVALLGDPDVMVRRNAALSLTRFGDASGRSEMLRMLEPYPVRAPAAGRVSMDLAPGQSVGTATLLARVGGRELRSPFAGKVEQVVTPNGSSVRANDQVLSLRPDSEQAWEALRGLYLVGQIPDLPAVDRFARGADARIREQAIETAQAIRARAEPARP